MTILFQVNQFKAEARAVVAFCSTEQLGKMRASGIMTCANQQAQANFIFFPSFSGDMMYSTRPFYGGNAVCGNMFRLGSGELPNVSVDFS